MIGCAAPSRQGVGGVLAVRPPGPGARTPMPSTLQGWKASLLGLVKKHGDAAKFVAATVLAAVPGGSVISEVVGKAIDAAKDTAQDHWEQDLQRAVNASEAELERMGQVLDILQGDLGSLMTQLAALEGTPEVAARILRVTLATDERARAVQVRLEGIAAEFAAELARTRQAAEAAEREARAGR